jgi:hypothetical protein
MRSRTSSSSFDMVRSPETAIENPALLGCTIALRRIVFQHDQCKFPGHLNGPSGIRWESLVLQHETLSPNKKLYSCRAVRTHYDVVESDKRSGLSGKMS